MLSALQFSASKGRAYAKEVFYTFEDAILVAEDNDYEINVKKMKQAATALFDELMTVNKRLNQGENERKVEIERITKLNMELEKKLKNAAEVIKLQHEALEAVLDSANVSALANETKAKAKAKVKAKVADALWRVGMMDYKYNYYRV